MWPRWRCWPFRFLTTWSRRSPAAGTTAGNATSWHVEQCFGGTINWNRSLRNAEALHAGLIAAKGWNTDTALVKHQYWYGKWCPGQVLNKGLWSYVVKDVSEAAEVARLAMGGDGTGGAKPIPLYARSAPIAILDTISKGEGIAPAIVHDPSSAVDFIWVGDRYRVVRDTPRYRYAAKGGEVVGPNLRKDEEVDGDWVFFTGGEWWFLTPYGTRVVLADLQRIRVTKGAEAA